MKRPGLTFLLQFPGTVLNYSATLFYTQWSHRYLLYLGAFVLFGIWTYVGLEVYGHLTWRVTSISFRGNHILHTMINFGLCLYLSDEWLARLAGRWGRFEKRTLGKQALIWGLGFVAAFYVQRTMVFEGIQYYDLDIYHYYQVFPRMRPMFLDHFLFCLPFYVATVLLLWMMIYVRQIGMQKEQKALELQKQTLVAKEKALREKKSRREIDPETETIYLQSGSSQIILDQNSISHVTVEDHYCRIYTLEGDGSPSYFIKSSLADLLGKLSSTRFIQIHRSHVVNVGAIRKLDKKNRTSRVHLKTDKVLPVSRHRLEEVTTRIKEALEPQGS